MKPPSGNPAPPFQLVAASDSGICFIMALRGLSSPSTSRGGNRFGMFGMGLALLTTLLIAAPVPPGGFLPQPSTDDLATLIRILIAVGIGGGIGWFTAQKIKMTDMPQLVAAFHSLVGMAAVLVGLAAYLNPVAFGIAGADGIIEVQSRIEMGLGIAIGAITFSGSVIAFLKLAGKIALKGGVMLAVVLIYNFMFLSDLQDEIKAATDSLMAASQTFSQKLYEAAARDTNAAGTSASGQSGSGPSGAGTVNDDEIVDAEIVDDK